MCAIVLLLLALTAVSAATPEPMVFHPLHPGSHHEPGTPEHVNAVTDHVFRKAFIPLAATPSSEATVTDPRSLSVALGTCAPYQVYETPVTQVTSQQCASFRDSACCDYGTAYRAVQWARQDDGCGVLRTPTCQQFITELSCHMACAPNQAYTSGSIIRPMVCQDWLQLAYQACVLDAPWCAGLSSLQLAECTFAQQVSTRASSKSITYTQIVNSQASCTYTQDLTADEWATRILGVSVNPVNCTSPVQQQRSTWTNTATNGVSVSAGWSLLGLTVAAILAVLQ